MGKAEETGVCRDREGQGGTRAQGNWNTGGEKGQVRRWGGVG